MILFLVNETFCEIWCNIFKRGNSCTVYTHTCKIQLHMYDNKEEQSVFGDVPYTILLLCFKEFSPANDKGLTELMLFFKNA